MTRTAFILALAAPLLLSACSHVTTPPSTTQQTPLTAMRAAPAIHESTARYQIDITYPLLPTTAAALATALQDIGASARQGFLNMLPEPGKQAPTAARQKQLHIDFKAVARSPRFISVREEGWANTGGAHPIPIDAAMVYDRQAGRLIELGELFVQPQTARTRLAQIARGTLQQRLLTGDGSLLRLREMIVQGTQPTADNYRSFLVLIDNGRATGLRLVFSAYQVAPYVMGAQTVDIPAAEFADLLKPTYRAFFKQVHLPD